MLQIRSAANKDSDVLEKGPVAFLTYIEAYKLHELPSIFRSVHTHCVVLEVVQLKSNTFPFSVSDLSFECRWKELEIGKLGMGLGLLQLPPMYEIRHKTLSAAGFVPYAADINFE